MFSVLRILRTWSLKRVESTTQQHIQKDVVFTQRLFASWFISVSISPFQHHLRRFLHLIQPGPQNSIDLETNLSFNQFIVESTTSTFSRFEPLLPPPLSESENVRIVNVDYLHREVSSSQVTTLLISGRRVR